MRDSNPVREQADQVHKYVEAAGSGYDYDVNVDASLKNGNNNYSSLIHRQVHIRRRRRVFAATEKSD
jgi:hypothetical protein